ncbi:LLM class flavin-dependent oxidoreductase [Rhodobacter sp. 24-YEA-8]|uniref:LLM class flavin-dependent oxidoreductase n=1 Tax=Rhodobacter sp. 24-YEA-8 TaxID=1884310 RepID=UPI0008947229|nr:LLM class flavin-dependent oxidoreductase [Rhodobacter sp. 24-YEA-8]SED26705.1 FMN-dependent oxidoreductase, nitrilotriacetate monooxygenase family [Rhodobacter sp. 24-YEA-8]
MSEKKHIIVNAFNMNSVGHINHGQWVHPRDRSMDYTWLDHWTGLAKTLERGLFDGIFLADILGTYDVYGGNVDVALRESVQLPVNDPILLVSAMASVTEHLGFGITVNVNQEHPYTFARRISTLDHLTGGRIGWNVVTGYLDSAARAVGRDAQEAHDRRYDLADDYLDVLYKLWEGSWEEDAVRRDRAARIYADPAKVHKIHHDGPFFRVDGYHLSEPSPQRSPVIYQAGTSGRGQLFAARHAECVFISAPEKSVARAQSDSIRRAVVAAGRRADDVKILTGVNIITDPNPAVAREKLAEFQAASSPEAGLAHYSASTGIDFAKFGLDDPVPYGGSNAIQSAVKLAESRGWTKRDLLAQLALGGRYPLLVGTPSQVADELVSWIDEGGLDGFNLSRLAVPESYADFADLVVPELQSRGLYKTGYAEGTLRRKLFAQGDRLPARHAGAAFRRQA